MNILPLNEQISTFYDQSTDLWLSVWGEHMHHGFYGLDGSEEKTHYQAQLDLIEALLAWGEVKKASRILDAGCGVGGSARYLSNRFGCAVLGLTLSPIQAQRAQRFNRAAGLEHRVKIDARDMMTLGDGDGLFDLIWSLESAEHIADKALLFNTFFKVLAPGGQLMMITWCVRAPSAALHPREIKLLKRICSVYRLPPMTTRSHLSSLAGQAGFIKVQTADWSAAVAPFWRAVIRSVFQWKSIKGLVKAGWPVIQGALAMRLMVKGYRSGTIQFGVLKAFKQ